MQLYRSKCLLSNLWKVRWGQLLPRVTISNPPEKQLRSPRSAAKRWKP